MKKTHVEIFYRKNECFLYWIPYIYIYIYIYNIYIYIYIYICIYIYTYIYLLLYLWYYPLLFYLIWFMLLSLNLPSIILLSFTLKTFSHKILAFCLKLTVKIVKNILCNDFKTNVKKWIDKDVSRTYFSLKYVVFFTVITFSLVCLSVCLSLSL